MEIPFTVKARPDTGLWNAKIGIWLFLASEVMLFGGLFSAYVFLRIGADAANPWPHGLLNVPVGTFNTVAQDSTLLSEFGSPRRRGGRRAGTDNPLPDQNQGVRIKSGSQNC